MERIYMNNVKILDCTLRDGGYINNWNFGQKSIKDIICKLTEANIDIIECGFLTTEGGDFNKSLFKNIYDINKYIEPKCNSIMYVGMIAFPNDVIKNIPLKSEELIDGIRVTFHKNEIDDALSVCQELIDKGYKVFIQPVGMTSYDDIELIKLIKKVNKLKPYAFYIVDTLGIMYKNDLLKAFYLIDNNLEKNIAIGFHSHNNLQLSFSNAQELTMLQTKRTIIIDSSVYGMGRGAGNLCTELITEYINHNIFDKYKMEPILEIMDDYLNNIYSETPWGYRAAYCLAAINNCHPNYASYLINRQTISISNISSILTTMDADKRTVYDKEYIVELYNKYLNNTIEDNEVLNTIKKNIGKRPVLIVGPGKSIIYEKDMIEDFIKERNPFIVSINFIPNDIPYDSVFISNLKRFKNIECISMDLQDKLYIKTSNIKVDNNNMLTVNYSSLTVESSFISDNAGLMLINLLKKIHIDEVYIAGLDGYEMNKNNYINDEMELFKDKENINNMNIFIKNEIEKCRLFMKIIFITKSKYD